MGADLTPSRCELRDRGVAAAAFSVLDARLERRSDTPLVVAFSGGGDSLALLLIARAWAGAAGRSLLAVTVDHGLQAPSATWAEACADRCERLGVAHRTVRWEGPKPSSGLAAAARRARHALISEAAREAGARVILMGHTADDMAEAAAMRAQGATTPSPRCWSPSPVWPEGRGIFLLRPLLAASREELRAPLRAQAESWIEDPANQDPASLRARVRQNLAGAVADGAFSWSPTPPPPGLAEVGPAGEIRLDRAAWASAPETVRQRWLGLAIACAAGAERVVRGPQLARLAQRLGETNATATLGGACVEVAGDTILIAREVSDRRRPAPVLTLGAGEEGVWDGRFLVRAEAAVTLQPLAGHRAALAPALRTLALALPARARPSLPLAVFSRGDAAAPSLVEDPRLVVTPLVAPRFAAAAGWVQHETDNLQWRNGRWAPSCDGSVTRLDYEPA